MRVSARDTSACRYLISCWRPFWRRELKRILVPLAGLGAIVLSVDSAAAASPDYCAVFAKEFAAQALSENEGNLSADLVHDRLYHKCLNMDEEPALPTAYAAPQSDGVGRSLVEDEQSTEAILEDATAEAPTVDATAIDEALVKRTAAMENDAKKTPARREGRWSGSGYAMWSSEWRDWCAEHFPNSFDPKTGTIMPYKTGKREPCL
jgi:hypothetical protein